MTGSAPDSQPYTAPRPGGPARRLLAAHSVIVYLFLYAPIAVLAVLSFNAGMQVSLWRGFSFRWYQALLTDPEVRDGAVNSLLIAGLATVTATVVGTMAAIALARWDARSRRARSALTATRGLLYLPLIVPEIILGVALLTGFTLLQVRLSLTTVVIAHVAFTVSYVAVVVRARLAGLDRSLEEAAADLGAGPLGAFVRVTLPLAAPGIAAGALLAFTISLDDYVVTSLVAGSESQTLPVKVYSMIHNNVTPEINAVCTVLLVFTVALIGIAQRLMRPPPSA